MNELKNNYVGLDYPGLKVSSEDFGGMAARVNEATAAKRKIKVK